VRPKFGDYFMILAKIAASRSVCNSRPVGCVLVKENQVVSTGYNGPPPQSKHCTEIGGKGYCHRRALNVTVAQKQDACRASHAEINAVAMAAKQGISIAGTTLYITLNPCLICLKALRVAGVRNIIYELQYDMNPDGDFDKLVKSMGFNTCFQWRVSQEVIDYVKPFLDVPTSYRRLKEVESTNGN
jgi:dCMP deaminase